MENIEYKGYQIGGNPFDVIMECGVELLRNQIFNVLRIRTETEDFMTDNGYLVERIEKQYDIIRSLTDEEVNQLRKSSVLFTKIDSAMSINDYLCALKRSFKTIWCETNPEFSEETEKIFLGGESSSDYIRRNELKKLTIHQLKQRGYEDFSEFLYRCIDVLDSNTPKEETEDNDPKTKEAKDFISEYVLSIQDVEFLKSVSEHYMKDEVGFTESLLRNMTLAPDQQEFYNKLK